MGGTHLLRAWTTRCLSSRPRTLPHLAAPPLRPRARHWAWGVAGGAAPVRLVAADPAAPTTAGCAHPDAAGDAVGDRGDVSGPGTGPATPPVPLVCLRGK